MPAPTPTVASGLLRRLPAAVLCSFGAAAVVTAVVVAVAQRPTWWNGFAAATIIAGLSAVASLLVLRRVSGRGVDEAVTFAMGVTLVRMAVSGVGLLVATQVLGAPVEPTGFMICGYYAATLVTETLILSRAAGGRDAMAEK
jgi:hypothetical protein